MTGVVVACALPNGLSFSGQGHDPVVLNGPMNGEGYAYTEGVDGAAMDAWLELNAEYPPVKQGRIFTAPDMEQAVAEVARRTGAAV